MHGYLIDMDGVIYRGSTLINGAKGGKIDKSMIGKRVTVVGGTTDNTINATSITISDKKGKKKKNT